MSLSFGVLLLQDRPAKDVLEWSARFDEAGANSIWVADHLINPFGLSDPWYNGWDLLAAIAGVTSTCRIGPLVSTFVLHSPLAMARHIVTVDSLSDGRLDFGIGAGGAPVDRAIMGVQDSSVAELASRMDFGMTQLLSILNEDEYPVPSIPVLANRPGPESIALGTPFPQAGRLPIVVGGQSKVTIDLAAKYATRWNSFGARPGNDDVFGALVRNSETLVEQCVAYGRNPSTITRSVLLDFHPAISPINRHELAEIVGRLYELGFEECIAYGWAEGMVQRSADELLAFVSEDLSELRRSLG